jgi:hypothetical protein
MDNALNHIRDLWGNLDGQPRTSLEKEHLVGQAMRILQRLADEFDSKRSRGE